MRRKYLLQLFSGVFDYIPVHKQGKKKEYKKSTTQPNIKRIKKQISRKHLIWRANLNWRSKKNSISKRQ